MQTEMTQAETKLNGYTVERQLQTRITQLEQQLSYAQSNTANRPHIGMICHDVVSHLRLHQVVLVNMGGKTLQQIRADFKASGEFAAMQTLAAAYELSDVELGAEDIKRVRHAFVLKEIQG